MFRSFGFRTRRLSLGWWLIVIAGAAMWLVAIIPSGIDVFELVVFTAPGAALGLFLRWASCLFARGRWNWRMAAQAAVASGILLPPLLAALVTIAGLQRPEQLLTLFVLGAWIALGVGMLVAALGPAPDESRQPGVNHSTAVTHATHKRPSPARSSLLARPFRSHRAIPHQRSTFSRQQHRSLSAISNR